MKYFNRMLLYAVIALIAALVLHYVAIVAMEAVRNILQAL